MKKTLNITTWIVCIVSGVILSNAQSIIYVDFSASGSNNGTTWGHAYNKLSDALAQIQSSPGVPNFEVRVAAGTYYPAGTMAGNAADKDSSFLLLRGGVKLYGGYPNGGGMNRNSASNPVYLDGTASSYHVMLIGGLDEVSDSVVVDGFTIRNGNAIDGGTISFPTGFVYNNRGGGIYIFYTTSQKISIRNCTVTNNHASFGGGGISTENTFISIERCSVMNNTAVEIGAGILFYAGDGSIFNSIISGNESNRSGAGIHIYNSTGNVYNCVISGNKSRIYGAAIETSASTATLSNCIISGNFSGTTVPQSVIAVGTPFTTITNSIIYGNSGSVSLTYQAQVIIQSSLVQNSFDTNNGNISSGGIELSQVFVDPISYTTAPSTGGDFRPQFCSPVINKGINGSYPGNINTDTDSEGNPRLFGTDIDMGAYEYQASVPAPQITCPGPQILQLGENCTVELPDYTGLAMTGETCVKNITQSLLPGSLAIYAGSFDMGLTVTDMYGLSSSCTFTITKEDNTPPAIICPETYTLNLGPDCSAQLPDLSGIVNAIDNCGLLPMVQTPMPGTVVSGAGAQMVVFNVTDESGLSNSCSFIVTKEDNTSPDIECFNQNIDFNGENNIPLDENNLAETADNCGILEVILSPNTIFDNQFGQIVPVQVTVTDNNGNDNTCISQITVGGLPSGWSQNINGVGCSGGNDIDYNSATSIWTATSTNCYYSTPYTSDATAFAQRTLCGDGSITAQVSSISGTALGWAGVIMRESNSGGAKKAQLSTNMAGNQNRREFRTITNGSAYPQNFLAQNKYWLKIERSGNQFTMYNSTNGIQWYFVGTQIIVMGNCIQMGLVATNYSSNSTITATFANVSYTGNEQQQTIHNPGMEPVSNLEQYEPDFSVYPNPASSELYIDLKEYTGKNVHIKLYSIEGKLIQHIKLDEVLHPTQTLLVNRYPIGMYFVKIKTEGLPDMTKRIVLSR